ncbi:probable cytochrome P450 303a1 [Atheta coriaria]|uniref:probable cytochrome P450 303a1 n=1 Tax=Dalotia coriaria TaxID=877792 RepID=UPI0031F45A64
MWAATLLFSAFLILFNYLYCVKPRNYPPGPKWLPILGSALSVSRLRKKTGSLAEAMAIFSRKYGPVLGFKFGQERIVICYGGLAIKEFLNTESLNGRPMGPFYELRTFGRNGILLTDEQFWVEQRRFILRHLREFGFGKRNMSEMIEAEADVMVNHIKHLIGNQKEISAPMDTMFGIHILNTIWTMLAGTKYNPEDSNLKYLQNILTELFKNIDMIGTIFSYFPFLIYFAPEYSGYNLYMKTHVPIWKFITQEIEKHKKTHVPGSPRDLIDVYLEMLAAPEKPASFTDDQLLAICLDLFMAGSETTTKSMSFCMLYLLLNPDVQRKAQTEIDMVVGRDRVPSLNDRPNMPYLEAIVMETLRHFMRRTFGVPHRALKDTHLCGHFIPKDTMVIPTFHGIFEGAECMWKDPYAFRPERFIVDGKVKALDMFIPFGMGKRRCLGETLARGNLFIFIGALLQNFDFKVPAGCKPPTTDTVDGVTAAPRPFRGIIAHRTA